jgi:hypothetical protein
MFKDEVEPLEIATGIQREMQSKAAVVSADTTLVPNRFTVALSRPDFDRLSAYRDKLESELALMAREYAAEQRYLFVGPVIVELQRGDRGIGERMFTVVGIAEQGPLDPPLGGADAPALPAYVARPTTWEVLLDITTPDGNRATYALDGPVVVIGRSSECDIPVADSGVSRRHLQLDVNHRDGTATATDLGSTNGTFVNGRATRNALVRHGDGIRIGKTELVLRAEAG